MAELKPAKATVRPRRTGSSTPVSEPRAAVPTESTHEQLERDHNRAEHERHEHAHGTEWDSVDAADTFEPWADYDLGVMPRGV